ncbi:MAG: hypothetical protein A3H91_04245 [Gammaproteobacteria bacterium RIFCSPLOWO2_02_FULL_61_13]|nr:MAG: hypothetical protein A3H91_04245 [Gammaproteobacteria bacterium RIFCSPLOWO2_02_FULL_61_13]
MAVSFAVHLVWELAQLPLYLLADESKGALAYAVLHCTAGDALIAGGAYLLAGFALREPDWPVDRPWSGAIIAFPLGIAYTAWSEWDNVYRAGNWAYASGMPLVLGIGLAPLLQWIVVPALVLVLVRGRRTPQYDARAPIDGTFSRSKP